MIECIQFKMIGEKKWLVLENVIVQIAKITTKEFIVSAVKLHLTRWGCASVILERTKKMDQKQQIEEMADIIAEIDDNGYSYNEDGYEVVGYANSTKIASVLIYKGYRKERQGEWVEQPDGTHFCSNCGKDATYNYDDREICGVACTYCGARMKGE